jgi:uncharacterized protein
MTTTIDNILRTCRVIAVAGLSPNAARPSHEVSQYMQAHGYRIVPVNPNVTTGTMILGEPCYPTLTAAAAALAEQGTPIDMVDCFRKSADIPPLADEAIAIGAKCLWLQIGVVHEAAAAKARTAGLNVVMNKCLLVEHARR